MDPELLQRLQDQEQRLKKVEMFMRSFLNAAEIDPQVARTIVAIVGTNMKLSDLSDVENTDGASTGQVLKKTSTTWQPGADIDT